MANGFRNFAVPLAVVTQRYLVPVILVTRTVVSLGKVALRACVAMLGEGLSQPTYGQGKDLPHLDRPTGSFETSRPPCIPLLRAVARTGGIRFSSS